MIKLHKYCIVLGIYALSSVFLTTGCKKKPDKIDLESVHTTAAETMAQQTSGSNPEEPEASIALDPAVENAAGSNGSSSVNSGTGTGSNVKNLSTVINTYTSEKISIQYPSVMNLDDTQKKEAIDELLKKNALSVISGYQVNEKSDTLSVTCKVLSADRNRITVIYKGSFDAQGAAYPTSVFYTNTVNVSKVSDIGFSYFADPYTMAGYVLSGDVVFPEADADLKSELMNVKNNTSLEEYTKLFTQADFPVNGNFPSSFSYEHEGNIYFSIPVIHALGDYAIIMYTPDTK